MKKYAIGIDFGTLSCRALLVSLVGEDAGAELACAVCDYPHGVMDKTLSASGESLPADYALQDPEDYLYALSQVVPEVIAKAGVDKADVVSVGVDFTCSTLIPVYENGLPLCFDPKFAKEKHAYVKLWKHHAAQPYADRITELATQRGEPWIARMGGKVSSEFTLPKLWELLDCAPDVYEACDSVVEAGDFIVSHLVGQQVRSYVTAAYKAQYSEADGYPSEDFLAALDERLRYAARDKLSAPLLKAGSLAGRVTRAAAENFGLPEGAAVSVAMPDAHVAAPAMGVLRPGKTVGIFGTSNCYYFLSEEDIAKIANAVAERVTVQTTNARIGYVTLLASKWVGTASPYSQVVTVEGATVTEKSQVDLTPSVEQLAIFHNKDIAFVTENEGGVVTVYAIGQKPELDYTIQVTITEVAV